MFHERHFCLIVHRVKILFKRRVIVHVFDNERIIVVFKVDEDVTIICTIIGDILLIEITAREFHDELDI